METAVLDGLIVVGFVLLIAVTGGIGYLTFVEWGDRRRASQEKREQRQGRRR